MDMSIELNMYEALTSAGVEPDAARQVERQFEAAIRAGHESMRTEVRQQLMTKSDGSELKVELLRALNEQTWKLVSFVVVANGIMLAILKYML